MSKAIEDLKIQFVRRMSRYPSAIAVWFDYVWGALSKEGSCDVEGSAEWLKIRNEFFRDFVPGLADFIRKRAGELGEHWAPSDGPDSGVDLNQP